jgi:hypothetical protein
VYKIAIKTNAYPADFLASFTLLTVKNEQLRVVILQYQPLKSVIAKTSTLISYRLYILKIQDPWKGRLVYPIDKCRFPELALHS